MGIRPLETARHITKSYVDYLATTFFVKDPEIHRQLRLRLEEPGAFSRGPIIEATPSFAKGRTPEQLVEAGILSSELRSLGQDEFPMDRSLYQHQDRAIEKAVASRRNIVVATGTGSGKTEAFMIPILNHLFCQREAGTLGPGVRALLLYPMNALANDQMRRLRRLLKHCPSITFGRYTGETRQRRVDALDVHRKMFKADPPSNELISRDDMQENPPHILLTNYAMLEYLLLRPHDHVFFDGDRARCWRFIVVDEAHIYTGAKGIEMAMLLRRLKDRIVESSQNGIESLQCIATSATLGSTAEDCGKIAHFAADLFDAPFEWVTADESRQDVITATRTDFQADTEVWGCPDPSLYARLNELMNRSDENEANKSRSDEPVSRVIDAMADMSAKCSVPSGILGHARLAMTREEFLYRILCGDSRLHRLASLLSDGPQEFDVAVTEVFGSYSEGRDAMAALIELATRARLRPDDRSLLPARYHMFIKAVDGAYLNLYGEPKLSLERMQNTTIDGDIVPVFEIASCRRCGSIYLAGKFDRESRMLRQASSWNPPLSSVEYYWLVDLRSHPVPVCDLDEDQAVDAPDELSGDFDHFELCTRCGSMDNALPLQPLCECDRDSHVVLVKAKTKDGNVHSCPACGAISPTPLVHRFSTGSEAVTAVLGTALYQKIPPRSPDLEAEQFEYSREMLEWNVPVAVRHHEDSRGLLVFSDSRQDAAFFATYLDSTYNRILRRRIIMKAIEEYASSIDGHRWRIPDIIEPVRALGEEHGVFFGQGSRQYQLNECWKWVLYELISVDPRNCLSGLGCLSFESALPPGFKEPLVLTKAPLELSPDEVRTFYHFMISEFARHGAVEFPAGISIQDEFFSPRNRQRYFRQDKSDLKVGILSWASQSTRAQNRRVDYIAKLIRVTGNEPDIGWCKTLLANLWQFGFLMGNKNREIWLHHFVDREIRGSGIGYQVRSEVFELRGHPWSVDKKWWICDKCRMLTRFYIRGVCPTYRCDGHLQPCDPDQDLAYNHYRKLYLALDPVRMRTHEHTAQLSSVFAADIQTQFENGDINVLSCSTTFELGVDVGDLESVFLRNVPPTAANYVQRAGRAGRRGSSVAFSLTYANAKSHDFSHFRDPFSMVRGKISPPHFDIVNEKIVRRHMYAMALASYWRRRPNTFYDGNNRSSVQTFLLDDKIRGYEGFRSYLDSRPAEVAASLQRVVPRHMHADIGLADWRWVDGLTSSAKTGVLDEVWLEIRRDLEDMARAWDALVKSRCRSDRLLKCMETLKKRDLIGHLSSRNVLPKYGFPVDVVELGLENHKDEASKLELTRDLRIAISEYAPSSEVVAAGKVWTSRYIKRPPNRSWICRRYAVCEHCGHYQSWLSEVQTPPMGCSVCHEPLSGRTKGSFIVPEFGFISDPSQPKTPGESKPEKTYSTRVHYAGSDDRGSGVSLSMRGVTVSAVPAVNGRLAVLNHAGYNRFRICPECGYAVIGGQNGASRPHKTAWGATCTARPSLVASLGHEFESDVVFVTFEGYRPPSQSLWESLLYAVLEGASQALNIERDDLDGCLHPQDVSSRALVLFDDVPGGAGHVRRIAESEQALRDVIVETYKKVYTCTCGGDLRNSSCYGCLRNYRNQHVHDILNRGQVIRFLEEIEVPDLLLR